MGKKPRIKQDADGFDIPDEPKSCKTKAFISPHSVLYQEKSLNEKKKCFEFYWEFQELSNRIIDGQFGFFVKKLFEG